MAVVMASTTQTDEQLRRGVSDDWREQPVTEETQTTPADEPRPLEELPPVEFNEIRNEEERAKKSGNDPTFPKKRGGYQRKIDKLTAKNSELQQRLARYEGPTLASSDGNGQQQNAKVSTEVRPQEREPQPEVHRADHAAVHALESFTRRANQIITPEERAQADKIALPIPVLDAMRFALVNEENGHEVLKHLIGNHDFLQKAFSMTPDQAYRSVVRIAGALSAKAQTSTPRKEKAPLPKPLNTVGGSNARSSVPMDELPMKDFIRIRNQQLRERGRRV